MSVAAWVERLLATAAVLGGYPVTEHPPPVMRVPLATLQQAGCAGGPCEAQGAYIPGRGVLLLDTLDIDGNPRDRSVLVHELVHYLQDRFGRFGKESACDRYVDREMEAYGVQDRYLSRYNMGLGQYDSAPAWLPVSCLREHAGPDGAVQTEQGR